jgi:hypothetical protein
MKKSTQMPTTTSTTATHTLSKEIKAYLMNERAKFAWAKDYLIIVNVELANHFGWTTVKSAARVIRRHPEIFSDKCHTRPNPSVPNGLIYELNKHGFEALMRLAHNPVMRSPEAMHCFLHGDNTDDETMASSGDDDDDDEDDNEDGDEERGELEMEMPVAKRQRTMVEAGQTVTVTEESIAAVMDQLADNAHKVQAANPQCKFPVGVSAKTAEALGWTDEYRNIVCETRKNKTLVENRDYQVCFDENRGCRVSPAMT